MDKIYKCGMCGLEDKKIHSDIYDCQDLQDPTWMYKWLKEIKKERGHTYTPSRFVRWSKKFPILLYLLS